MELNLTEKLTKEEQNELTKRIYSTIDTIFREGLTVGRELSYNDFTPSSEEHTETKLKFIASEFMNEEVWKMYAPTPYKNDEITNDVDNDIDDATYHMIDGE